VQGHPEKPLVNGFEIILKLIVYSIEYVHLEARAGMKNVRELLLYLNFFFLVVRKFLTTRSSRKKISYD
jgi:hypothetical protein